MHRKNNVPHQKLFVNYIKKMYHPTSRFRFYNDPKKRVQVVGKHFRKLSSEKGWFYPRKLILCGTQKILATIIQVLLLIIVTEKVVFHDFALAKNHEFY